ncbi:MAG: hypothetical protein R3C53_25210 [Pirellulaceae bacterium]
MKKPTIVTSGVDSEYVLQGLCSHLRNRGYPVIELDFGKFEGSAEEKLRRLRKQPTVYITSAHTNLSIRVAEHLSPRFAANYPNYLSPVEIIPLLEPKLSMYVPHDLLTPYGDENLGEIRMLGLFDHVLAPYQAPALQATLGTHTKVHDAGWVKYAAATLELPSVNPWLEKLGKSLGFPRGPKVDKSQTRPRIALFVSMIEHLRTKYGVAGVVDYLRPLLNAHVYVKFPVWSGIAEIEQLVSRDTDAIVVPSTTTSIDLIRRSDIVICNSASSIHAESCLLGVPVVCLLDDEGISCQQQIEKLSSFQGLVFHDYRQRAALSPPFLEVAAAMNRPPQLKPFDLSLVESLIEPQCKF